MDSFDIALFRTSLVSPTLIDHRFITVTHIPNMYRYNYVNYAIEFNHVSLTYRPCFVCCRCSIVIQKK